MTKTELFELAPVKPDAAAYQAARERWDGLSKPLDGLGDFESLVCRLAAIQRTPDPDVSKRGVAIMCADNGVVDEGVSQCGREVTKAVAVALGKGTSSASVLARSARVDVIPVDIGIACDGKIHGVLNLKVARGTKNFVKAPAMEERETLDAISTGITLVRKLADSGLRAVATGEMGIGNTTTTTAVLCALLRIDCDEYVGRGAGLDDAGLARKRRAIKAGLYRYDFDSAPTPRDRAFRILQTLGGLDIAGLVGICIGGALRGIPVVLDGVISSVAALVAETLVPGARDYLIASHTGREKGNRLALGKLGLEPFINGDMALGEGTGAIMLFPLIDMALDFYRNASTFKDVKVEEYQRFQK